jgi:hypothetical protein
MRRSGRWPFIDKEKTHYYQPGFLFIPFGMYEPEDLVDEVEDIITVGEMLELAGGEQSQVVFV